MITTKLLIIFALFGFNKLWFYQAAIIDAHINDFDGNFNSVEIAATGNRSTNVFMQLLASQNVHKSHRFFYMLGERRPDDKLLTNIHKQTGFKFATNVSIDLKFPESGESQSAINYVFMTVYQQSDINFIHLVDGGLSMKNIHLHVQANETKYVTYDLNIYGV